MPNDGERDHAEEAANRAIDHEEGSVMITLTYPRNWQAVWGHDQHAAITHLTTLGRIYRRAWGKALTARWALEFLRSGQPCLHLLMVPPAGKAHFGSADGSMPFREWISAIWSNMVGPNNRAEYAQHLRTGVTIHHGEGLDGSSWVAQGTMPLIELIEAYRAPVPQPWPLRRTAPPATGDAGTQPGQVDMVYFLFPGLRFPGLMDDASYADRSAGQAIRSEERALQLAKAEYVTTGESCLVLGVAVGYLAVVGADAQAEQVDPIGDDGECPLGDECPGCHLCTRAQIKAWADALDTTAESLNDHCLPVVAEMRRWLERK